MVVWVALPGASSVADAEKFDDGFPRECGLCGEERVQGTRRFEMAIRYDHEDLRDCIKHLKSQLDRALEVLERHNFM